ncbi:hypothetical protein COCOBI_03-8310 [Coccomyxa sp. Obi]|nr:hypothetical protein COCOBI_03-8310 [Coccomyxa sp. Obi]
MSTSGCLPVRVHVASNQQNNPDLNLAKSSGADLAQGERTIRTNGRRPRGAVTEMTGPGNIYLAVLAYLVVLGGDFTEGAVYAPVGFNLCGSQFTDGSGVTWYGKTFITPSSGGTSCVNTTLPISISTACTAPNCDQTQLQQMFQISQMGYNLAYSNVGIGSLGKQNTNYLIAIYFADYISTGAGQNVFNIVINGKTLATGVDVYALGGGNNQAVSFGLPVFSSTRSNFDISFPTTVGTSIAAGIEFGYATNTTLSVTPSTATWGDTLLLQSTVTSLNPNLLNVTSGSVQWTLNDTVLDTATVSSNADGTATATGCGDTTLVGCEGGTFDLIATYIGTTSTNALMYSSANVSYTVTGTCGTTTPEPTTSAPPTTTITPSTSAAPSTTPETTMSSPPTTTAEPSTTPEATTATPPPTTGAPSTTPEQTTSNPPTTTEAPTTMPATTIPSSTPVSPSTTPASPSTTPVQPSSTPANPSTTPAVATSIPLPSTTVPPTTGNITVDMTMDYVPNPAVPAQPLTIFGDAVASSGPAPTGNVTVFVDGVPVATAPVVPVPEGGGGRRRLLQQSSTSVFSVTIIAPSTPGVHTIIAVFVPSSGSIAGGITPVVAPVTVTVVIPEASHVDVTVSNSYVQFPFCKAPLTVVAAVAGTNNTTPATGSITLSIIGASSPHVGAAPLNVTLASANITSGATTFDFITSPITAAAEVLVGTKSGATAGAKLADMTAGAKLLPGSYQVAATYSGDGTYLPARGSATLVVGATCPVLSLTWQP